MTGSPLLFIYSDAATIDSSAAAPLAKIEMSSADEYRPITMSIPPDVDVDTGR